MTNKPSLAELKEQAIAKRDTAIDELVERQQAERAELERTCDQEIDRLRDGKPTPRKRNRTNVQ